MNLVHRNSFPKLSNFPWYFTQLGKFQGEANDEKHADPRKKNRNSRKSRKNSRNLLEIEKRRETVRALWYEQCPKNSFKGSTPLRGCWFWSENLHFQKNFCRNFIAVEGVTGFHSPLLEAREHIERASGRLCPAPRPRPPGLWLRLPTYLVCSFPASQALKLSCVWVFFSFSGGVATG